MYVEPDSTLVLPPAGSEMRTWLDAAQAACDAADVIALRHFRQHLHIEEKPDRSFVTQADTAIEAAIRARLTAEFPQHGLVGEEYGTQEGAHPVRWIIDPIDGTHNYMRGVPLFGTLLGLEVEGVLVLGVLSAPALGHRWFAWSGGGAWEASIANGTWDPATAARLRVSGISELGNAQLVYSSVPQLIDSGQVPGFTRLMRTVWRDRGFGDFWGYALVAGGMAEAMVEIGCKAWDLAGPAVLVHEAGGRFSDLSGTLDIYGEGIVVASNGVLHEEILRELRSA
ncbi:MAG: inositol monophosphatase family protein [Chloroflexota bacterium]